MTAKPSLPDQSPTLAERLRDLWPALSVQEIRELRKEAASEIESLTLALAASESEKETYRARWLSCVTPEEAERLRQALAASEAEREKAERHCVPLSQDCQNVFLDGIGDVWLDYGDARLKRAEAAEAERDSLREQLAQAVGYVELYVVLHTEKYNAADADPVKVPRGAWEWLERNRDAARKRSEDDSLSLTKVESDDV